MKIGVDIMGGDFAPENCLAGAVDALNALPADVRIVLIGDTEKAKAYLNDKNIPESSFDFVHAPDVIEMGEHPTKALAQKPNSSISIGYKLLKENEIQSFASAGNTGAMLVGAPASPLFSRKRAAASALCSTWAPTPIVSRMCCTSLRSWGLSLPKRCIRSITRK
jgi:fatty acid/phospholipid biosynthesis enzyme